MALEPVSVRPDICLYRATPSSGLQSWLIGQGHDAPPFWAYVWGGGAALALHLVHHPELVAGKSVVDLGAGSGLVGIAALKAGAARVHAVETDPFAQVAAQLNAQANGVPLAAVSADLPADAEVILAGDVFYDAQTAAYVLPLLTNAAGRGQTVLIGDPYRKTLPLAALKLCASYDVPDFGSGNAQVPAGIFQLA